MPKKPDKSFPIQLPSNQQVKTKLIDELYMKHPELTRSERFALLMEQTGISKSTVDRYRQKLNWDERTEDQLYSEKRLTNAKEALRRVTSNIDISLSSLPGQVKDMVGGVLDSYWLDIVHLGRQQNYWLMKINTLMDSKGMTDLTPAEVNQYNYFTQEYEKYSVQIKKIVPINSMVQLMKVINLDKIGEMGDDIKKEQLTPDALGEYMVQEGYLDVFQNAEVVDEIEEDVANRLEGGIPDVSGLSYKDVNQAQQEKKRNKNKGDEK